jgi:hypothetical protein
MSKKNNPDLPSESDVSKFKMLENLLESIYKEMKEFSKKKPDEPLNKFKVKSINRVLEQIKEIMKDEPTNEFLDLLDEESLPSNSDCILIIGQFNSSMEQFRRKYYVHHGGPELGDIGKWSWSTKENP